MSTVALIREGLAEVLAVLQDDEGKPQVDAYARDNVPVPSIRVLRPETIRFDVPSLHCDSYTFTIQALVGLLDDYSSQVNLDVLISRGVGSIKSAIETLDGNGSPTLNGRVDSAWVVSCTGYREYEVGGARTLGAEWEVSVDTTE